LGTTLQGIQNQAETQTKRSLHCGASQKEI